MNHSDALVHQQVFDKPLGAVSNQDIAIAVMTAMRMSNGRGGLTFHFSDYGDVEVVSPQSKWGYKGTEGNDGYGLWTWEKRIKMPWRGAIEAHVARWRRSVPRYSTDHAACREMESEIERRGLGHDYSVLLAMDLWGDRGWEDWRDTWSIVRATPAQRVRAALRATPSAPAAAAGEERER